MNINRADRIKGSLLAGALGDAIGACYEGLPPNSPFEIPESLFITDDTQLTLATCESIMEEQEVQPESIAKNFLRWFRQRRIRGIGASTLKAVTELDAGGHWAMVGATGERSAGNGAAMRIAPLAFVLDPDVDRDRQIIRDVCWITHQNDEAYLGALSIIRTIRHGMNACNLDKSFLDSLIKKLPDSRVRDRFQVINESSLSVTEYVSQFAASGYVVDSVPLAILTAIHVDDYLSGLEQIVQCGGDTDTIASMFGNIYGALHGTEKIPLELMNRINEVSYVQEVAEKYALLPG